MILIGLGANLHGKYGTPENALRMALEQFPNHNINIDQVSSIWESAPVPVSDQPWYKNAVCSVQTGLLPHELLKALSIIENEAGRVRSIQNAPRVLDLDLLAYHDRHISDEVLSLPHPEMHNRAFVLYPLHEIAPNWVHPILHKSVNELMEKLPKGQEIRCMIFELLDKQSVDMVGE